MNLHQLVAQVTALGDEGEQLKKQAAELAQSRKFIPSPGPQTEAYFSKADVLLYGGEAGGGKTGLLCGLALEEHKQSLLMRRNGVDLQGGGGVIAELLKMHGGRDGFSGKPPPTLNTEDGRVITFGAAQHLGDEEKYQGRARDLLGLDEATQFLEQQVRFLMGWVRTTVKGQRTRTVLATNPPVSSEGTWIIGMFRPWLDVTHPNPAKHGELRWFVTVREGSGSVDLEVDGPEPVEITGEDRPLIPTSRTFIPAALTDNPFIQTEQYQKQLDALPEPYRSAIRDGNFMAARADDKWQVIPTEWVRAAQARWTPEPPEHAPMSALAVDVAQGGADQSVLQSRYDAWFAEPDAHPGVETPDGPAVAGLVVVKRRNACDVVIDMGGGWGQSAYDHLKANSIKAKRYIGSKASSCKTVDSTLGFFNKRAEAYWRFREALDPGQQGGSDMALPPDQELLADLTAPTFSVQRGVIKLQTKEQVTDKLGRSPDKGDAAVMCWSVGPKVMTHGKQWRDYSAENGATGRKQVRVVQSHASARRKR